MTPAHQGASVTLYSSVPPPQYCACCLRLFTVAIHCHAFLAIRRVGPDSSVGALSATPSTCALNLLYACKILLHTLALATHQMEAFSAHRTHLLMAVTREGYLAAAMALSTSIIGNNVTLAT